MKRSFNRWPRFALIALASFGVWASGRLSVDHLQHGEVCPMLGPIPACIIVFLGYSLIVLAAVLIRRSVAKKLFYIGWAPVFLLAFMGVTLELTKGHVCPPGPLETPQCFFSLAMAVLCFGFFKLIKRYSTGKS